jgi:hypothetical protein
VVLPAFSGTKTRCDLLSYNQNTKKMEKTGMTVQIEKRVRDNKP